MRENLPDVRKGDRPSAADYNRRGHLLNKLATLAESPQVLDLGDKFVFRDPAEETLLTVRITGAPTVDGGYPWTLSRPLENGRWEDVPEPTLKSTDGVLEGAYEKNGRTDVPVGTIVELRKGFPNVSPTRGQEWSFFFGGGGGGDRTGVARVTNQRVDGYYLSYLGAGDYDPTRKQFSSSIEILVVDAAEITILNP